ncbi:MAG: putative aminopeptidase YsdC [Anaerolineales bacterium]|nr:putative aminopeptidase YsdC [Anaerolineales bacterium]
MKTLIRKMCQTFGPSGNEEQIREAIIGEIKDVVDEYRIDALGNLITVRRPRDGNGQRVMLAAHMDEIGVIVTHVDDDGFLRFAPIGGVLTTALIGARVVFANGVEGTFGVEGKPLPTSNPDAHSIFLDVGAASQDDVPVSVGDAAAFRHQFADQGGRLIAQNFDDRIGCAVLIEALRGLADTPHEVYGVFTVQEEVGLRGATTSAFGIAPDVAIAIDVTATGDTPEAHPMAVALDEGPAIKVKDRGMLAHPGVKRLLVETAQEHEIPYQLEVLEFGSTDARAIQVTREGVPAGVVSIPTRYLHTPSQMVAYADVQHCVQLLTALLSYQIELAS